MGGNFVRLVQSVVVWVDKTFKSSIVRKATELFIKVGAELRAFSEYTYKSAIFIAEDDAWNMHPAMVMFCFTSIQQIVMLCCRFHFLFCKPTFKHEKQLAC